MDLGSLLRVRPALRTTQELEDIQTFLQGCTFFVDWADESLTQISGVLGCASFGPGEKVSEPGEAVISICILLSGSCEQVVPHPTDPRVAPQRRVLHPGDVCGREAVLSHDPRSRASLTAGPSGALFATLTSSAWADVCARAATGSPTWVATRSDLLCSLLRQLLAMAQAGAAGAVGPAAAAVAPPQARDRPHRQSHHQPEVEVQVRDQRHEAQMHGTSNHPPPLPLQQQQQQQQALQGRGQAVLSSGDGLSGSAATAAAAAAAAGDGGGGGGGGAADQEGPAEALRLELIAVLLASFPSTMTAMPQSMLREAAKGCHVRTVHPYGVLYSGRTAPKFQAVLLSGEVQVRRFQPVGPGPSGGSAASSRRTLMTSAAASPATPASPSGSAAVTAPWARGPAGAASEAPAPPAAARGGGGGGGKRAAGAAVPRGSAAAAADGLEEGAAAVSGQSGRETAGEVAEAAAPSSSSSDSSGSSDESSSEDEQAEGGEEDEEGEEDVTGSPGADDEAGGGSSSGRAAAAEKRLEERFGPVVATETRGSVVLELPLHGITRHGGRSRAPPNSAALTAGAAPATVLIVPLHALHRGYQAARAALVESRVGGLSSCRALAGLNPAELAALALAARPLWLAGGGVVARQGDPVDALYLVQVGEVLLLDDPDGIAQLHHHHHHHHHVHHHLHQQQQQQQPRDGKATVASAPLPVRTASSSALLAAFLEDPVMSSEGSKPPWALHGNHGHGHHGHGHHHGHSHGHGHGTSPGQTAAAAGAAVDVSAAQAQRTLAQLVPLMIVEPGGLLGESVLGYLPEAQDGAQLEGQDDGGAGGAAGGGGGGGAEDSSPLSACQQLPPLHSPTAAAAPPPLSPAPPPTALPAATTARSPLQQRQSVHHRVAATAAGGAPAAAVAAAAYGDAAAAGGAKEPNEAQKQERDAEDESPAGQQQQQQLEDAHNHHKQIQHLHRLLTKHGQDHLMQQTDNHHNHHGPPTADGGPKSAAAGGDAGAAHPHPHRRGSLEITSGGATHGSRARGVQIPGRLSLEIPSGTTSGAHGGHAAATAGSGAGSSTKGAAAAAAAGTDAAAIALGPGAFSGVFPATAVAVGAVRLLALPRAALLRLPQLQPVLAALATGQLRVLELRRRDAQETRDRLQAAAASAAASAATADGGPRPPAAAAPPKDPYAETRRRQAERRAAVGALNSRASTVRAPEVRPTDEMMARPSVVLEKMGFKVPKLRGLLGHHQRSPNRASSSSSEQPQLSTTSPQLDLPSQISPTSPMGLMSPVGRISSVSIGISPSGADLFSPLLGGRSQSVTLGAPFGGSSPPGGLGGVGGVGGAATTSAAKLPALPRFGSGVVGAVLDADFEAAGNGACPPLARISTAGGGAGGGGSTRSRRETGEGLRSTSSLPIYERFSTSFSSQGRYPLLPRISTEEVRVLRSSITGSAHGERTMFVIAAAAAPPPASGDPRSCSGSPMRRSPRVYDMESFVNSAAVSRAGSFSGTMQQGGPFRAAIGGGGGGGGFGADGALLASTGSPRMQSLSGVPPSGPPSAVAAGSSTAGGGGGGSKPDAASVSEFLSAMPTRAVSFSNLSRLVLPPGVMDDGPMGRSRRTGNGVTSPGPIAARGGGGMASPVPPSTAAAGCRPQRISFIDDGRLPALPAPQRPSRLFQDVHAPTAPAGGSAAALSPLPQAAPPMRPSGGSSKSLPPEDLAVVARWMDEHTGGGSAALHMMLNGQQTVLPQAAQSLAALSQQKPAAAAGAAGAALDPLLAVTALRKGSETSQRRM